MSEGEACKAAMLRAARPQGNQKVSCKMWGRGVTTSYSKWEASWAQLRGRTACPSFLSFLFHLHAFPVHPLLPSALPAQVWEAAAVQGSEQSCVHSLPSALCSFSAALHHPRMLQPHLAARSSCARAHAAGIHPLSHTVLCSSHAKGR